MAAAPKRPWTNLPSEAIVSVAERLEIKERLRLRLVCPSWASAMSDFPHPPCFPWLVTPKSDGHLSLLSLFSHRCYSPFPQHSTTDIRLVGCHGEWLVAAHRRSARLGLLNPFTGSQIPLPSFDDFTNYLVKKVLMSASPLADDVVFAVITCRSSFLRSFSVDFFRHKDGVWKRLHQTSGYVDCIYHEGKFFLATAGGSVFVFEPADSRITPVVYDVGPWRDNGRLSLGIWVSSCGRLLQVRVRGTDGATGKATGFAVYELACNKWYKLVDLGDRAIFLDSVHGVTVSAGDVPGLRANCIYFADIREGCDGSFREIKVFDIKKGIIEPWCTLGPHLNYLYQVPPVWLCPES